MARYNEWMNSRLYVLCAQLTESDLRKARGAFFGSIYLTLNHIAYGDTTFLARFTGIPSTVPSPSDNIFGSFASLRLGRAALDHRILGWAETTTEQWLAADLTYESRIDGRSRTIARWARVAHMFNHQTHHRGQVTALLSQLSLELDSTDIPFMPEFQVNVEV